MDPKLTNASVTTFNDGVHDTLICIKFEFLANIQNVIADAQWRLPDSADDNKYEKIFFRTRVNVKKILQGVRGNFLITLFVDSVLKSVDFELKFPMKKVRLQSLNLMSYIKIVVQQLL